MLKCKRTLIDTGQRTKSLMWSAHEILRDGSIGPNAVNLVIVKLLILTVPQQDLAVSHHAQNTLTSFGKWVTKLKGIHKEDGDNYDYAVLLTRYDICKDKDQPCDTLGLTHIAGMCKFPTSASVIEDNGLMAGFTLAHQTGHNLGIDHDGVGNPCIGANRIMNENAGKGDGAFTWSYCSVDYLQQFLSTPQSRCLSDEPPNTVKKNIQLYSNVGKIYDARFQCKLIAGEEAKECYYGDLSEICVELMCLLPGYENCLRTGKPAADGTSCGNDMWCKKGRCSYRDSADDSATNGGWTEWTELTLCTRSCGGGISYRERRCQNPKPKHGGNFCEGDSRQYVICNKQPCPKLSKSFRHIQCESHFNEFDGDLLSNWTYTSKDESNCLLECSSTRKPSITKIFGRTIDGTDCFDVGSNLQGRCVAGRCMSVGCDLVLGSKERVDRCGVCKGDGSSCRKDGSSKQTANSSARNVTNSGASSTSGTAVNSNMTSLQNASSLAGAQILDGNQTANDTHLNGVLHKLMTFRNLMKTVVMKKCLGDNLCLSKYEYYNLKRKKTEVPKPGDFEWVLSSSGCSATCGSGTETLYPECRRNDDGSPVARMYCSSQIKPAKKTKACKLKPCRARWVASDWDTCSKSCNGGTQSRFIQCIQELNGEYYMLHSSTCGKKPQTRRRCNTDQCPPEWMSELFTPCSTSCGKGIRKRTSVCKLSMADGKSKIVEDAKCDSSKRPVTEMLCNIHNPCPGDDGCGGTYKSDSDTISSPNFPESYPSNKECVSEITVSDGKQIELTFKHMNIVGPPEASNGKCGGDFLRVIDGGCHELRKPSTLFCGNQIPDDYISSGNTLCLKFVSDDGETDKGFALEYKAVDKIDDAMKIYDLCDVKDSTVTSPFGVLLSPNYPERYPVNEDCKITVQSPDGSGFVVAFEDFNVGSRTGIHNCENDFLEVYHDNIPERICGHQNPGKVKIPGNSFTASFHSGPIRIAGFGFVMTYITKDFLNDRIDNIKHRIKGKNISIPEILGKPKLPNQKKVKPFISPLTQPPSLLLIPQKLSSMKKNAINHPNNSSAKSMEISDQNTLKAVLDILGSGSSQNETIQKSISASTVNKPSSKIANRSAVQEDYSKAAIVKKGGIPALAVLPQSDAMLLRNFEKSISVHEKPQLNETGTKTTVAGPYKKQKILQGPQNWYTYYHYLDTLKHKRKWIPVRPYQNQDQVRLQNYYRWIQNYYSALNKRKAINYPWQQSYFNPTLMTSYNGAYRRQYPFTQKAYSSCPAKSSLNCYNLMDSFSCRQHQDCIQRRMLCCQTSCPFSPYMCVNPQ